MLVGNKVIIEEIDPKNIEQLRVWRNNPVLRKNFRFFKDISVDNQLDWYKKIGNNSDPKYIYFQIMKKNGVINKDEIKIDNKILIGCCNLSSIDFRMRSAEFGIFLSTLESGKGFGKEALLMMCEYGFKALNLNKIWAEVFCFNPAVELYKKIGFSIDGIIRDSYFYDGRFGNSYYISMLQNEWLDKYKNMNFSENCS